MADRIRFHLDESCSVILASALRHRGIEITTPRETGLLSASDEEHLEFARTERRVIITHDPDYLRLHARGFPHAGIAYSEQRSRTHGELIQLLVLMWEIMTPDEMDGHVEFL
jgi:hypothetical protein